MNRRQLVEKMVNRLNVEKVCKSCSKKVQNRIVEEIACKNRRF